LILEAAGHWLIVFPVNSEIRLGDDAIGMIVGVFVANPAVEFSSAGVVAIPKVFGYGDDFLLAHVLSSLIDCGGGGVALGSECEISNGL
jgi:hypothetical protein